jgi:hypothetical protein
LFEPHLHLVELQLRDFIPELKLVLDGALISCTEFALKQAQRFEVSWFLLEALRVFRGHKFHDLIEGQVCRVVFVNLQRDTEFSL